MGEAARGVAKVARMLDKAFAAFDGPPEMAEYWHGTFAVVPDRRPRLYRLAPRLVFGGIYSGRGVALALSLGQEIGRWAAGRRLNTDMPLPVTAMKPSPFHPVAVAFANRTETGSTGSLRPDFDPKFLSLMLKTDFLQMGTLLELLRGGLVPAFRFEVGAPQSGAESPVTGWSMDSSFEISDSSQG